MSMKRDLPSLCEQARARVEAKGLLREFVASQPGDDLLAGLGPFKEFGTVEEAMAHLDRGRKTSDADQ